MVFRSREVAPDEKVDEAEVAARWLVSGVPDTARTNLGCGPTAPLRLWTLTQPHSEDHRGAAAWLCMYYVLCMYVDYPVAFLLGM